MYMKYRKIKIFVKLKFIIRIRNMWCIHAVACVFL